MSGACVGFGRTAAEGCSKVDNMPQDCRSGWYFTRKELENNSPSRKDGIDLRKEAQLRMLYCSFLQDVGMRLRVPQATIATAIMLCHRFYLQQSHAKNEWQTIATVCMFLASKVEDTPCYLDKVVVVAYETMYQKDPVTAQRIQQKDVFEKQKALILTGERLLLCTVRFDFNIHHPYRPLHEAFKKFQITQKEVRQTAWNFVNDWLRTTLCLQYKPNYIAAGSLYLAAKHHNVKLTSGKGCAWWQELEITPHQLNAVVQQMIELLGHKRRPAATPVAADKPKLVQPPIATPSVDEALSSPDSCVLSDPGSTIRSPSHEVSRPTDTEDQNSKKCNPPTSDLRESENPNGVVEDSEGASNGVDQANTKLDRVGINVDRIRALMRARKRSRESIKSSETMDDCSEDAQVERELEAGIELAAGSSHKKQKL